MKPLANHPAYRHEPAFCRRHRKERGASLLESIAYLGVAAIVIVGAIALLGSAFSSANTNRLAEELNAIQTGTKKLYMGQVNNYGNGADLNANLVAARVFPSTLPVNGAVVSNAWGGNVAVTGQGQTFTVAYTNVPRDICINTLTAGGNWRTVAIGQNGRAIPYPVSPTDATAACADNTTITWTSN
ncbi:pilus assembly protein [Burkholderia stagnalis]|uniref:Pilus assembly protein n=1 Tax=Burkholderia stagnalis TaxID=1503054 RepID=A0A6L3MM29_9BURK|nr:type 4 pilus major pilin [Burkholderia stagnalis]KAB0632285.1 pilus assembly protein [Burkholderia stagnalis]KVO48812.1 pilus assembly protein [Burkholderia stagnalis]KVO82220.1 pilus assembly protein [Burkholderia stagnalis]KVW58061.1 pilus assembly protein [Burkholderia stagnalis]KVW88042.1 pilus assembly protein [Burkholderia stagnalis]